MTNEENPSAIAPQQILRWLSIAGIVLGAAGCAQAIVLAVSFARAYDLFGRMFTLMLLAAPVMLLAGSIGGLRCAPWARRMLLAYAWLTAGLACVQELRAANFALHDVDLGLRYMGQELLSLPMRMLWPAALLLVLTRPAIKAVFIPSRHGFEPLPVQRVDE